MTTTTTRPTIVATAPLCPSDMVDLADGATDVTGGVVWPGAHALQGWIDARDTAQWVGADVLELGCGTGYCGIAAALRGARVHLTDGDEAAVALAVRNCAANAAAVSSAGGATTTAVLAWTEDGAADDCSRDVVLAAEVVYNEAVTRLLLRTAARALRPGGEFVLAFVPRILKFGVADMVAAAAEAGLAHEGGDQDAAGLAGGDAAAVEELDGTGACVMVFRRPAG